MTDLYPALLSAFTEALPTNKENGASGTIEAIRLKKELEKKKFCTGTEALLNCAVLDNEIQYSISLERDVLDLLSIIIEGRDARGGNIEFSSHEGKLWSSLLYTTIRPLYTLRYGAGETLRLDEAFLNSSKDNTHILYIDYERYPHAKERDMGPESFFIKRIYFRKR
jgi:hypothetical protein